MTEPLTTMKAIGEAITSFWGRSALLLWCLSLCAIVALAVLLVGTYFQIDGAAELFHRYAVLLMLACVLLPIVAGFRTYSERPKPSLVLLPIEDTSFWGQSVQPNGKVTTQFMLRFQATNMTNGTIVLSEIVLRRPPVGRKGKPIRVMVSLRDHSGRWHKLVFPYLRPIQ